MREEEKTDTKPTFITRLRPWTPPCPIYRPSNYVEETDYARLPNAPYSKTGGDMHRRTPYPPRADSSALASPCS